MTDSPSLDFHNPFAVYSTCFIQTHVPVPSKPQHNSKWASFNGTGHIDHESR